jgi:hypothetical protein
MVLDSKLIQERNIIWRTERPSHAIWRSVETVEEGLHQFSKCPNLDSNDLPTRFKWRAWTDVQLALIAYSKLSNLPSSSGILWTSQINGPFTSRGLCLVRRIMRLEKRDRFFIKIHNIHDVSYKLWSASPFVRRRYCSSEHTRCNWSVLLSYNSVFWPVFLF